MRLFVLAVTTRTNSLNARNEPKSTQNADAVRAVTQNGGLYLVDRNKHIYLHFRCRSGKVCKWPMYLRWPMSLSVKTHCTEM